MQTLDIAWNDEARAKILADSDRVLREAVLDLSKTMSGHDTNDCYSALYARLKDRFIDFKPGPDIRKFADAIASGDFADADDASTSLEVNDG